MNDTLVKIGKYVDEHHADQSEEWKQALMARAFYNYQNGAGTLQNAIKLAEQRTKQSWRDGESQAGRGARPRGY